MYFKHVNPTYAVFSNIRGVHHIISTNSIIATYMTLHMVIMSDQYKSNIAGVLCYLEYITIQVFVYSLEIQL